MKKLLLSVLCLFVVLHFGHAQWGKGKSIKGNGTVKKESRNVSGFNAIAVSDGIDVYIHQGNQEKLEIEADENIIPIILTEVNGQQLKIHSDHSFSHVKKLRVDVWAKDIRAIAASGGSDVYSEGTINADDLKAVASGGADLELSLKVDRLECNVSGGSDAELDGTAGTMRLHASGGSDIKAYDLQASKCVVKTSGGSDAFVNVSDELDLTASGGSDVHYKGGAKITNLKVSGSSDVHH